MCVSDFHHLLHTVHAHDPHRFCRSHAVAAAGALQLSCAAGPSFAVAVSRVAGSCGSVPVARKTAVPADADFVPVF